jgi:hypothetical protein
MKDDTAAVNIAVVVGLIGFVVLASLVVAAFSPIFGSVHEDAINSGVVNGTDNSTYTTGVGVAQGFMGFDQAIVYIVLIVLIIVVLLLIFAL